MIPEQTLLNYPLFGDNATKVEPDNNKKSNGWQQADVVPAEWMNWAWYHNSKGISDLNDGVKSMEKEINNVLDDYGITPAEATEKQLSQALAKIPPQICSCSTAASTAAKEISIAGNVLKAGNVYVIEMDNANTASNPTLSINGGTAYPICYSDGTAVDNDAWASGEKISVVFTGANFIMTITSSKVDAKIKNLDVSQIGGNGRYIYKISQEDGLISADSGGFSSTPAIGDTNPITAEGVKNYYATMFQLYTDYVSIPSSSSSYVEFSFTPTQKPGYTLVGIVGWGFYQLDYYFYQAEYDGSVYHFGVEKIGSAVGASTVRVTSLYIKNV